MARDISRYLEVRADVRRVLPAVQVSEIENDWYAISGSGKRGMFTKLEFHALKLSGLLPYQDRCEATGDEIQDAMELLLTPCGE